MSLVGHPDLDYLHISHGFSAPKGTASKTSVTCLVSHTHTHTPTHLGPFVPVTVLKLSVHRLYTVTVDSCIIEQISLASSVLLTAASQKFAFAYLYDS